MKKVIWTRKQQRNLLHDLKNKVYNEFVVINRWIESCKNREQLQNIINFMSFKIDIYHNILDSYELDIASSLIIYKDFRDFFDDILQNSEIIYNRVLEEIIEKEQQESIKKPIVVKGFCDTQVS